MTEPCLAGTWRKSSFSRKEDCVEFRRVDDGVEVRNSKRPDAGLIHYTDSEWTAFVAGVKSGEFDI